MEIKDSENPRTPSIISIYSIYDENTKSYDVPFFVLNEIQAKRHFIMVARQEKSMIRNFIDEFALHFLGTFDKNTGVIVYAEKKQEILHGKALSETDDKGNSILNS